MAIWFNIKYRVDNNIIQKRYQLYFFQDLKYRKYLERYYECHNFEYKWIKDRTYLARKGNPIFVIKHR